MGKNNRQRRAAKVRKRLQHRSRASAPRPDRHGRQDGENVGEQGGEPSAEHQAGPNGGIAWSELEMQAHHVLDLVWKNGWQPAELDRVVRRSATSRSPTSRATAGLLRHLVAVDHARRRPDTLHPRWHQQIRSLDLPETDGLRGWLAALVSHVADVGFETVSALVAMLARLSPLPRLIPPPGGGPADVDIQLGDGGGVDGSGRDHDQHDPVLERVRALLAKAESTSFPAEAEAFTAKAHELMTRHAIDSAVVEGRAVAAGWVTAVRIPVDEPYIDSKSLLLQIVAERTRCRAVFHARYAMSTVIGASRDLVSVELLFTSLLLQGQQALLAEGAGVRAGARERSRGFRSSFLMAYAHRIDERLGAVSADVADDVTTASGVDVLPVLADRQRVVDDEVDRVFGTLGRSRHRPAVDAAGWSSGRQAADRARLGEPDLPATGSAGALAS